MAQWKIIVIVVWMPALYAEKNISTYKKKDQHAAHYKKQHIDFSWPVSRNRFWLSSRFGFRRMQTGVKKFHYGIDMAAHKGTPVCAAADGIVTISRAQSAGSDNGYGNMIHIKHNERYQTRYAHLNTVNVKEKQWIKKGDIIGTVGDTGLTFKQGTDASHLHFEIHENGKQIDPLSLLPSKELVN